MTSNAMNRTLLIYASLIAFLLGIAGSIIGNIVFKIYPSQGLVHITIIGLILIVVYRFVQSISVVLGVETLKSSSHLPIANPLDFTIALEGKIRMEIGMRLRSESFFSELIGYFIQFHIAIVLAIPFFLILKYQHSEENYYIAVIALLVFLFLLYLWAKYYMKFLNLKLIQFANSKRSRIDFILRKRLFLDPREYHLIIDLKNKCYYFTYYTREKAIEDKYRKIIEDVDVSLKKNQDSSSD